MDNKINEIRSKIRVLRLRMFEAEKLMRDQINRDEDCSTLAQEILGMRSELRVLLRERRVLGDFEPILLIPPLAPVAATGMPVVKMPAKRLVKRQLRRM